MIKIKSASPVDILALNWLRFNKALSKVTEQQLSALIEMELKNANRPTYVERLHTRLNGVRYRREKKELAKRTKACRAANE